MFVSGVLVEVDGATTRRVTSFGVPPLVDPAARTPGDLVGRAVTSSTFVVAGVGDSPANRVEYAYASAGTPRYVVYVERAIPPNRRVAVENDSAFSDLHFATYIGPDTSPAALATTTRIPQTCAEGVHGTRHHPVREHRYHARRVRRAPPRRTLGRQLPRIFLVAGLVLTALAATWTRPLILRRETAKQDAATIQGLSHVRRSLCRAAGHRRDPAACHAAALRPTGSRAGTAFRYVAGARGSTSAATGTAWPRDDTHVAFVVGDVRAAASARPCHGPAPVHPAG